MIITNPPYSLKDEFLKKCYEWNKPFCLLLPITALEGKNRGEMYRKNGIEVLVLDGRVQFMEKKIGNWFNTSWFCHNVLPEKLIFKELKKKWMKYGKQSNGRKLPTNVIMGANLP